VCDAEARKAMAQKQLTTAPPLEFCDLWNKNFSNKSNLRRHVSSFHHGAHSCSVSSDTEFSLRCIVTGIVEELISGNFTRPVPELLADV